MDFLNTINFLKSIHFYDIILPFLLVYSLTFGILLKSRIFKTTNSKNEKIDKNEKSLYSIISFVFGLIAVGSLQTVIYLNNLIINIIIFIVFILTILISLSFVFGEDWNKIFYEENKLNKNVVIPIVLLIVIITTILGIYALNLTSIFTGGVSSVFNSNAFYEILVFSILIGTIYFISK